MQIIVTGATGFIGSYLCHYLKARGHSVIPFSRSLTEAFVKELQPDRYIECDVTSEKLRHLRVSADMIIHLASANEVISRSFRSGIEISVVGTKQLLDFAVRSGIGRFMFFSTLQVYGTEPEGMIAETTPVRPQNDYALNHLFAEQYVAMYAQKGLLRGAIIRPSNVYGRFHSPTVNRWTMVPACFCKEALDSGTITIRSSGKQFRSFVSLENVARACEAIISRFPDGNEIYLVGSNQTFSILDIARKVQRIYWELFSEETELIVAGDEPQRPNRFSVSTSKLTHLGYRPDESCTLEETIRWLFRYLLLLSYKGVCGRDGGSQPHEKKEFPDKAWT
ncbi:NAD(P)-dependent oxidoreductase [Paenibacillus sp. MZ04-78.2]|uniref:NAD-dependent epimerase/dehydratase family protein n=1 Tax=Paenibacillus sp. MZ04-78.2 TaxID=2962034 RepID=UPI0020B8CB68|nr:NAD(P)-dependent oxidoreductase [Paenibacillus sp. MZ04-78.2]MCP3776379.1 NAD(P)-dependent oxidoreductase [Paenibacillus sp. MZ04-78.2]